MGNESDDSDDDTFVTVGTPMPLYDKDEVVVRKPVALHDQMVRDEQGRVRFHGAFTGGFSAGYYNTVDTKEGWAPKTFVSSRSQKAEVIYSQKPEDFMDSEDFSEHGIAPRKIATTTDFTNAEKDHKRRVDTISSSAGDGAMLSGKYLSALVVPSRLSVGVRLLRKLGWKDGQGIGSRVKRKHKKNKKAVDEPTEMKSLSGEETSGQRGTKVYGCALPPGFQKSQGNSDASSSEDDCIESITFAPKDVCPIVFEPKDNFHGIGYHGINPKTALGCFNLMEAPIITTKGGRGIRGQAFGVGALEVEDDDIYAVDQMSNYDRVLGEEDNSKMLHGWTAPKSMTDNSLSSHKAIGYTTNPVIPGFQKSSASVLPKTIFPPPQLPRDFKPFHKFESSDKKDTKSNPVPQKNLDVYSRGALLGEVPHLKSVFELVSNEDQAKMEAAKMTADVQSRSIHHAPTTSKSIAGTPSATDVNSSTLQDRIEQASTPAASAQTHTSRYLPFAKNPEKQKRYELFLEATKHGRSHEESGHGTNPLTEWEQEREREEFMQAARLFKPMTSMIANRFTRAVYDDEDKASMPAEEKNSDQVNAAKMKMFGKMTREKFEWHPDKNLCKRFNIADPYPESTVVGLPHVKRDKYSIFNFLEFQNQTDDGGQKEKDKIATEKLPDKKELPTNLVKPLAILGTVDLRPKSSTGASTYISMDSPMTGAVSTSATAASGDNTSTDQPQVPSENVEDERPPMDLFKAIFENSDSSDDSSDEETPQNTQTGDSATISDSNKNIVQQSNSDDETIEPTSNVVDTISPEVTSVVLADMNSSPMVTIGDVSSELQHNFLPVTSVVGNAENGNADEKYGSSTKKIHKSHKKHKKHKDRKTKHKHSHSKSKHKKKKKSKKHKMKTVSDSSGSDADTESDGSDDDSRLVSKLDRKLLSKLKSLTSAKL